jgi:hypothetical protein
MIGARVSGRTWPIMIFLMRPCRSGGMADAADSKSVARKGVWVRLPPPAPSKDRIITDDFAPQKLAVT